MKYFIFLFFAWPVFRFSSLAQGSNNITDAKGFKQGKWVGTFESGKTRYEGSFKDNLPFGTFVYYYESGEKSADLVFSENGKKTKVRKS